MESHTPRVATFMAFQTESAKRKYRKNKPIPGDTDIMGALFGYPQFAIRDFKSKTYRSNQQSRLFILIKPLGLFFGILDSSLPKLQNYLKENGLGIKDVLIYNPVYKKTIPMFFRIKRAHL